MQVNDLGHSRKFIVCSFLIQSWISLLWLGKHATDPCKQPRLLIIACWHMCCRKNNPYREHLKYSKLETTMHGRKWPFLEVLKVECTAPLSTSWDQALLFSLIPPLSFLVKRSIGRCHRNFYSCVLTQCHYNYMADWRKGTDSECCLHTCHTTATYAFPNLLINRTMDISDSALNFIIIIIITLW